MSSGPSEVIWEIDSHTKIKLEILRNYLNAWLPIMSSWNQRLLYIDGFAGPGEYKNYPEGSPIVALKAFETHILRGNLADTYFLFIERDQNRFEHLKEKIKKDFSSLYANGKITIINDSFDRALFELLNKVGNSRLISSFVFIDPFGYSGYPIKLISDFWKKCKRAEFFITFTVDSISRFAENDTIRANINELYGNSSWKECISLSGDKRIQCFVDKYKNTLVQNLGSDIYIREFEMINRVGHSVYFLIFITKHWKGLEVMKKSMCRTINTFNYKYSDRTGKVPTLDVFGYSWEYKAAEEIYKHFKGKEASVEEIHKYVIENTPWIFKKRILRILEEKGKIIDVKNRWRSKTYPDTSIIVFSK